VVTNIDREHLDFYKDLDEIKETFLEFINKVPFYGASILCLEDENIQSLLPKVKKRLVTYGFSAQADFQARDVRASFLGCLCIREISRPGMSGRCRKPVFGK
jgi:UDP-N-acetylmuramate--alanine ligase